MSSSELYKVLGGILALGEFSLRELARFADVDDRAVRGFLANEVASFVHQRESGGVVDRYSLIPSARNNLLAQLHMLEHTQGGSYEREQLPLSGVPASLSVAEDIVLERLPSAVDDLERSRYIGFARFACDDARRSAMSRGLGLSSRAEVHRNVVECGLRLSEAEMAASTLGSVNTDGLQELWSTFAAALALATNTGDTWLVRRLSFRYLSSPLGQLLAQSQFASFPELPIQSRPILLFNAHDLNERTGPGTRYDAVTSFVRAVFEQLHIAYTPVSLFKVDADNLRVRHWDISSALSENFPGEHPADFTSYLNLIHPVCVLPVPSGCEQVTEIIDRFNTVCNNQPDRLVVDEKFNAQLNNLTFSHHGRYVPIEGLEPTGFMGAVFNGWPSSRGTGQ